LSARGASATVPADPPGPAARLERRGGSFGAPTPSQLQIGKET
jgi:hypothetical protein